MFRRSRDKYIILQEYAPLREQRAMEHAVVTVLQPVKPSQSLIHQLSLDLIEEARHQQEMRQKAQQAARMLALIGGGFASIIGALTLWLLWRRRSDTSNTDSA